MELVRKVMEEGKEAEVLASLPVQMFALSLPW